MFHGLIERHAVVTTPPSPRHHADCTFAAYRALILAILHDELLRVGFDIDV